MEQNFFQQRGTVVEIQMTKAIIEFKINDIPFRALLQIKNFVYKQKQLEYYDGFTGLIRSGDVLTFNCHPLASENKEDFVQFFATRAWIANENEKLLIVNQQGEIRQMEESRGVMTFDFHGQEQSVYFTKARFFQYGHKLSNKHALGGQLELDQKLMFDAYECEPTRDTMNCPWFTRVSFKGKRPPNFPIPGLYEGGTKAPKEKKTEIGRYDSAEKKDDIDPDSRNPHEKFEKEGSAIRENSGQVVNVLDEATGIALWMRSPNNWQTVFFHRSNAYIDDYCLKDKNLMESFEKDLIVKIAAVEAIEDFPCKWIARKITISTDY